MLESALKAEGTMPTGNRKGYCLPALLLLCAVSSTPQPARAQTSSTQAGLSVHWEELTGSDFIAAIKRAPVSYTHLTLPTSDLV